MEWGLLYLRESKYQNLKSKAYLIGYDMKEAEIITTLNGWINRSKRFYFFSFVILLSTNLVWGQLQSRQKQLFNFDWKFTKGDVNGGFQYWFEDSNWDDIHLPHDASVSGGFDRENSTRANGWLPHGIGWYRKHFRIGEEAREKHVFIQFQGVYRDAKVYINGKYLGRHLNGYLGFEHEISKYLNFDEDNVIAVHYDNTTKGTSRWYTGEGIYRDVWLVITDGIYIPRHGTCITTPVANKNTATINVITEVINDDKRKKEIQLVTTIMSQENDVVAEVISYAPVNSGETFNFIQELDVDNPMLWSCDDPNLYKAISNVYLEGRLVDDYETTFGIRDIQITADKGLLVNGQKVIAMGGNMHHDLGCLGSAALEKGYERKLKRLKAMGCNSIRLSHNPHAPVLLDVADRLGFLVFNEAYDKWTSQFYGGVEPFQEKWREDLTAFMRRDRNHPSVFIWSMGNEVLKQQGKHDEKFETPADASDYGVSLYQQMVDLARRLDHSRKITVGLFPAREKFIKEWEHWDGYDSFKKTNPAEMAFYGDVVSYNYSGNMFQYDHQLFPQLMFIASETSTNLDFGTRKNSWLEIDKNYVIGHYYWTATDYLGESSWPTKVWGRAFLDITDEMTSLGYLYKSFYHKEPMVFISIYEQEGKSKSHFDNMDNKRWNWYPASDHWNWNNEKVKVQAITNAEEVELFLNGRSLGKKRITGKYQTHIDWDVDYEQGELKAVALNKGKKVAEHVLKTAGEPVALEMKPDVESLSANGLDLVYIEIRLVDKNGVTVPDKDRSVKFEVDGEGYIGGVANGDIFSDEKWVANHRSTDKGKCLLVVRSNRESGVVTIKAIAEGIPASKLEIKTH